MQLVPRTCLTLMAAGVLLLNSACAIQSSSPVEPSVKLPISTSKEQDFLFFSFIALSGEQQQVDPRKLQSVSRRVRVLLEQQSKFETAVPTLSAPARGTYITFYLIARSDPGLSWCMVSGWTLFVVPCAYHSIYEAHFDLYVDNILTRRYQYDIHGKGVEWIGLVPFFWVNYFLTDYEDAFLANTHQFIADAKQDGLL